MDPDMVRQKNYFSTITEQTGYYLLRVKVRQRKFLIGYLLTIIAVGYLAYSGYEENKTYSHTVTELYAMKETAYGMRIQVTGSVVAGSIRHEGSAVNFVIGQGLETLRIRYVGKDAPDTLIDHATAIVTGTLGRDGLFVADIILVKSTSREEHAALKIARFSV
jgi:cytochrome c-type biogenesis protein CcmE